MRYTKLPNAVRGAVLIIAVVTAAVSPWSVSAQSNGPFSLTWSALGGGGGASEGGDFSLMASVGLPDAGQLAGGSFTVSGGFWQCTLIGDFSGSWRWPTTGRLSAPLASIWTEMARLQCATSCWRPAPLAKRVKLSLGCLSLTVYGWLRQAARRRKGDVRWDTSVLPLRSSSFWR